MGGIDFELAHEPNFSFIRLKKDFSNYAFPERVGPLLDFKLLLCQESIAPSRPVEKIVR
jgi:hypothetical protein